MHSIPVILSTLPDTPGVYIFKNAKGEVVYVGKATSLKRRVFSYWHGRRAGFRPIEQMIDEVARIETRKTGTVIEAMILEAALIKKYWPRYNVVQRDDKSFLYVGITSDKFPRVVFLRGLDVQRQDKKYNTPRYAHNAPRLRRNILGGRSFAHIFGPFTSARSVRAALDIMRKIFPWSDCVPPVSGKRPRACFYEHLGLCPGVCTGKITAREYRKLIHRLVLFFQGKRRALIKQMRAGMACAARAEDFESATRLRNQLASLEHIQDIALIQRDSAHWFSNVLAGNAGVDAHGFEHGFAPRETEEDRSHRMLFYRIEAYDISNISGTSAVGSMTVFENGVSVKQEYRKFKIKTVEGSNDVAMMSEVLLRRFQHPEWHFPDLVVIDGGKPQVNAARAVWRELKLNIPLMGIAKGPTRKRDEFILASRDEKLIQFLRLYPHVVKHVRDEAHRFAVQYHRVVRGKRK
ncbi:MAG: excinuclease ABC subunit UvrC [Candidatus Magasanikbacteria bacterium]|nr:excinuclease ABC subunit UvrC [Candidatus Magasanikbacteria bacterium]